MGKKAKLEAVKSRLRSEVRSAGEKARRAGNVAWKGLNSKPGRAAVYVGAPRIARLVLPANPVGAVAVLAVTAGVQAWADEG